jgi:ActR/RegA family two-component response regulator
MCHFVDYNGLSMTISDWSRYTGIHRTTITRRLKKGLPLDEVFKK